MTIDINNLGTESQLDGANVDYTDFLSKFSYVPDADFTVVKFFRDGCGFCKKFNPVAEEVFAQHPEIKFVNHNSGEIRPPETLNIRGVPTLIAFDNDGYLCAQRSGYMDADKLENWLNEVSKNCIFDTVY